MPLPGPGMFCAMFRKLLHPLGGDRLHICGKGGDEGDKYMLSHGAPCRATPRHAEPCQHKASPRPADQSGWPPVVCVLSASGQQMPNR